VDALGSITTVGLVATIPRPGVFRTPPRWVAEGVSALVAATPDSIDMTAVVLSSLFGPSEPGAAPTMVASRRLSALTPTGQHSLRGAGYLVPRFCWLLGALPLTSRRGQLCMEQASRPPRVRRTHLHAHHRRIYSTTLRARIGLQRCWPPHLCRDASYAVLVHRCGVLLLPSSRLSLAADALGFQPALPLAGCAADLNRQVSAPCRAHQNKRGGSRLPPRSKSENGRQGQISSPTA
jgi:hypothetical protein